jgi:DNA-binding transcriptional ArsR family regulator
MPYDPLYVRFFNLLSVVRDLSPFDVMTAEEDELLRHLLVQWHEGQALSTSDAMEAMTGVSAATAYRRIIKLRDKGFVHLRVDQTDRRVKFVEPTAAALRYAGHVHAALETLLDKREPA